MSSSGVLNVDKRGNSMYVLRISEAYSVFLT